MTGKHVRYDVLQQERKKKKKKGNKETQGITDREMYSRKSEAENINREESWGREMIIIQRHIITYPSPSLSSL